MLKNGRHVGQGSDTEDRWHARMLELAGDHGLPAKSLQKIGVLQMLLLKDLEDDRTAKALILGQQDRPHCTFGVRLL